MNHALGKFFPLFVLGGKRLDHALPQQAVLDGGVQFTDLHPLPVSYTHLDVYKRQYPANMQYTDER